MPTYEYCCASGHEFEMRQAMSDEPVETCREDGCEARAERRISMGGGVLFPGPGFSASTEKSAEYRRKSRQEAGGR